MTPAAPTRADPRSARRRSSAAAFALVGALLVPLPAAAAPAACEQAERYAAQSGAQLLRIEKLDLGPAGRDDEPITDLGVGDAKSAAVAQSAVNAAALARVLDGGPTDRKALADVLLQQAPPNKRKPDRRGLEATDVGPLALGPGALTTRARWADGMACAASDGDTTRAEAELSRAGVLEDGDSALLRVPRKVSSLSTTAIEGRGPAARTVASASVAGGDVELLGGAVRIKMIKSPSLLARMSSKHGGEVRYLPAVLEVTGAGIETARLDTAGDSVEVTLDEGDGDDPDAGDRRPRRAASDPDPSATPADVPDEETGLLSDLPELDPIDPAPPLPAPGLPSLPGVPALNGPDTEAASVAGPGTRVEISLGDVRQAAAGHAIAAKATAVHIMITQGPDRKAYGHSTPGVVLDFELGLLEVAAVSPEPVGGGASSVAGAGGGLPITGPRVDVLAPAGIALLIAGAVALLFGLRGRSRS